VTLDGKPFAAGTVVFAGPANSTAAAIEPDGSYQASNVPLGPVRVLVAGAPQAGPTPTPAAQHKLAGPPARYRSLTTSGLELTVTKGETVFDIPMTAR
jgi:hypothetical protein